MMELRSVALEVSDDQLGFGTTELREIYRQVFINASTQLSGWVCNSVVEFVLSMHRALERKYSLKIIKIP